MQSESTAASLGEDSTSSKGRGSSSLQDESHHWESTNAKSFDTAPSSSLSTSSVTTHQSLSDFSEQLRCWRQDEEHGLQALAPTPEVIDERVENLSDCSLRSHRNVALQDLSWDGAEDLDLVKQQLAILRQIQLDHHEATLKAETRGRITPDATPVDVKKAPHSHLKRHEDETPLASNASFSTCVTSSLASATTSSQGRSCRSMSKASSPTKRRSAERQDSVSSSHEDKILEEGKWLDHFNDPSAIREQHEIMQQIEDDKRRARLLNAPSRTTPARNEGNSRPTSSSSGIFTLENSKIERGSHFATRPAAPASCRVGSSLEANSTPSVAPLQPIKTNPFGGNQAIGGLKLSNSEGGTTSTYGRRKLHVLGKTKTVNAIAEGTALLVQCPGCRTVLQVSSGAKLVYCTVCSGVSPIELVHNYRHDQAIAAAVQDAELDLSYQQGLEKQRRRPR